MIPTSRTRNLGFSRGLALTVILISAIITIGAILVTAIIKDLDIGPVIVSLGAFIPIVVAAVKSVETADTSAKAKNAAELTASQNATQQSLLMAHISDICPSDTCPLKPSKGAI